jgi:hypothetical protein
MEHSEADFAKKLTILEEKQKSNLDLMKKENQSILEKMREKEGDAAQKKYSLEKVINLSFCNIYF